MEKNVYESPRFGFQELRLLERVADKCWGASQAYIDVDKDGRFEGDEIYDLGAGCGGNDSASINQRMDWFLKHFPGLNIQASDMNTNVKSSIISPIVS